MRAIPPPPVPDVVPLAVLPTMVSFWKVIAYVEGGALKAKTYVLTQDDLEHKLESLGLEPFKLYQVGLADLGSRTSLDFGDLTQADTMPVAPEALGAEAMAVRRIYARSEIVENSD